MGVPTFKMKLWSLRHRRVDRRAGGLDLRLEERVHQPRRLPLDLSFLLVAAVVLGGLGSTPGVIAGAFAVAFIPEYLQQASSGDDVLRFLNDVVGGNANDISEYRFFIFGHPARGR